MDIIPAIGALNAQLTYLELFFSTGFSILRNKTTHIISNIRANVYAVLIKLGF